MQKFPSNFVKYANKYFVILLMVIWTLTSADQCTNYNTACGTHTQNFVADKIKLTLITSIPLGFGRPVTQTVIPFVNPLINILSSLSYGNPTVFSIKLESYEICNGSPTVKTNCCRTSTQTCSLNNTESTFELPIIWDPYYKNKITIRAITRYVTSGSSYFSYAVYEASFDIQVNQTSIVPNNLINLTYLRSYIGSPENGTYLDFCNNL